MTFEPQKLYRILGILLSFIFLIIGAVFSFIHFIVAKNIFLLFIALVFVFISYYLIKIKNNLFHTIKVDEKYITLDDENYEKATIKVEKAELNFFYKLYVNIITLGKAKNEVFLLKSFNQHGKEAFSYIISSFYKDYDAILKKFEEIDYNN